MLTPEVPQERGSYCGPREATRQHVGMGRGREEGSRKRKKTRQHRTDGRADLGCQFDCIWNLLNPKLLGTLVRNFFGSDYMKHEGPF